MSRLHAATRRRIIRALSLLGAAASVAALSGCVIEAATVPAAGAILGPPTMYGAAAMKHGPRASFVNHSGLRLNVRYWVARKDITAPYGWTDIRTGDDMMLDAQPGDMFVTQLGRPRWVTSQTDALVRARVDVVNSDGTTAGPYWIQLDQPLPYVWAAKGDSPETLTFERHQGGGGITPVPVEQWIDGNNGEYPVYRDAVAAGR
ncbi:MAG: hypothetical protein SFZ24_07960 [Planctomycetota bacterium]|nr:hypothetical protein [Planctomycetota bacterium]